MCIGHVAQEESGVYDGNLPIVRPNASCVLFWLVGGIGNLHGTKIRSLRIKLAPF